MLNKKEKIYIINENDNVGVAVAPLASGEVNGTNTVVPFGHKIALQNIHEGEEIIKYGHPIGIAKYDIKEGQHVHSNEVESNLVSDNAVHNGFISVQNTFMDKTFMGYKRADGRVGVRKNLYIVPLVGCINDFAKSILPKARELYGKHVDEILIAEHPFGCSQLGDDALATQKILAGIIRNPNCFGALVVSLGCENNNVTEFKKVLGGDNSFVKFITLQTSSNEQLESLELIGQLVDNIKGIDREPCPLSQLNIGIKCGGSDAFSGITANAIVGAVADKLNKFGCDILMTEVPEMFGAEDIMFKKCINREVLEKYQRLISNFKNYFVANGEKIDENPSPGNKDGGITTLAEKSLGCVQKSGNVPVCDVVGYGDSAKKMHALTVINAPGNDIVSCTALMAGGAHIILFTTGRGTPFGSLVPTIKLSSNTPLYDNKRLWIDYNCGDVLHGQSQERCIEGLFDHICDVASGRQTRNEENGYNSIAIWKSGVVL